MIMSLLFVTGLCCHSHSSCVVMAGAGSLLTQCKLPLTTRHRGPDAGSRAPVTKIIIMLRYLDISND